MTAPRLPLTRSLRSALLTVFWAGAVLAVVECVLLVDAESGPLPFAFPAVFALYLCGGLLAWWTRPAHRTGLLLIVGSGSILVAGLANTDVLALQVIGVACATLPVAIIVHLMLAYPGGVLHGRAARLITFGVYVLCTVMQLPLALWGIAPFADRPEAASVLRVTVTAQLCAGIALLLCIGVVVVGWIVRAPPVRRRAVAPVYIVSLAMLVYVPAASLGVEPFLGAEVRGVSQLVALGIIPIVFVVSVLAGGYQRTTEIEELADWIGREGHGHVQLTAAVARALGDPSVEIAIWRPVRDCFVDADGHDVALPTDAASERSAVVVEFDERVAGAIIYDRAVLGDERPAQRAGRVVALALENTRLHAELDTVMRELRRTPIPPRASPRP